MFKLHYSHRKDIVVLEHVYIVCIFSFLLFLAVVRSENFISAKLIPKKPETTPLQFVYSQEDIPTVEAQGYVVYDVITNKVILGKNENSPFSLASMTKLMTTATAYELASSTFDSMRVTITPQAIDEGYDFGLRNGERFLLQELIKYMLVISSNDAANAVALSFGKPYFISMMNAIASREGFTTLHFTNPNGLDSSNNLGGVGSPTDVARLMAYDERILPGILDATTRQRLTVGTNFGPVVGIPNTNQDVASYVGIAGSKTGFTDEAGGNLAIIFDAALGHPVVIVVMGSSREGRFEDVKKLYLFTKKAIQ